MLNVLHLIADGPGADAFEQGGDTRRVTQARAMVDIVGTESRPYQFLEKVGLLVATFCRTKAGKT